MKTLDEVIKALEVCTSGYCSHPKHGDCPYLDERNDCDTRQRKLDALQWLKGYKAHIELDKLRDKCEAENGPLTWDELRQMEGKPVWVEPSCSFNRRRWMFVGEWFDDDEMRLFDMGYDYPDYVSKNSYESGTWQAYRKERK